MPTKRRKADGIDDTVRDSDDKRHETRNEKETARPSDTGRGASSRNASDDYLRGFVMMPFGHRSDDKKASRETQDRLFQLLVFAINDAFFQNYENRAVRKWKPIKLERADIGAGRSADLLDNVLRKVDISNFCVVDYTYENLNVALECGYALAHDKFLIPIQRRVGDGQLAAEEKGTGERTAAERQLRIIDLSGKLMHTVRIDRLKADPNWSELERHIQADSVILQQPEFFLREKDRIKPFASDAGVVHTYLLAAIPLRGRADFPDAGWLRTEEIYREDLVRPLYGAFRPLYEKLETGVTELEYPCVAYATREAANLSAVFGNAKRSIKILTTNLEGLIGYVEDIADALREHKDLRVEILTLNPDSEFVNARGRLIGKEISRFRHEMHESLDKLKDKLRNAWPKNVGIKTYSEFPTQITFFVDDHVFSAAVSVNHQSRNNVVFRIPASRKGVAESFGQHWDTIWARASEIG
ncbi:MAG: hypothetical protein GY835_18635 [bacterium]|nr:hypothetical protein [bacterium]